MKSIFKSCHGQPVPETKQTRIPTAQGKYHSITDFKIILEARRQSRTMSLRSQSSFVEEVE